MTPKIHSILLSSFFLLFITTSSGYCATKDAAFYLKQASESYNQKDYIRAERFFRELLKMDVALHGDFYYFYGKTLYHNGKYNKSVDNFNTFFDTIGSKSNYAVDAERFLKRAEKKRLKQLSKKKKKKKILNLPNVPEMVKIPAGSFVMGSNHGSPDQKPPHKISIKNDFAMAKYEVTFAQYDAFVQALKKNQPDDSGWGRGNRPVINVSLKNAQDYARWLSKKTNRSFRLPTELEWEYVARTGHKSQLGFNDLLGLGDANCDDCRYFWESDKTMAVGNFAANKYGVHDLFGNVWEWTCSVYTKRYNGAEKYCADEQDLLGQTVAVRGGGWNSYSAMLRSYVRFNNFPSYRSNELGFRLVEELD